MQLQNFRTDRLQHATTARPLRRPGIGALALLALTLIAGPVHAYISRFDATAHGHAGSVTTTDYGYDNDDRLIQTTVRHQPEDASRPDQRTEWTLDAVGNRLTETVTRLADNTETASKTYAYNNRDQLTLMQDSVNQIAVSYAYDGNGNRVSRTVTKPGQVDQIAYTFDARDRLIKAEPNAPNPTNTPTVEYVYDAEGRRVERIETPATGSPIRATIYLYDGATLAHEATPDASANSANSQGLRLTDSYRHSAKLAYHLEIDAAGNATVTFYQLDALDTPVALRDSAGNTQSRTTFDAWGVIEQQVANGIVQTPWTLPNYNPDQTGQAALLVGDGQSIGFTGYQKDPSTGLYYAGARWYDPLLGSFNGMDPANGNPESPVTFNKYLYANGNPLIFIDPDGRVGFLTSFRNFFNDSDRKLRLIATALPSLADKIGVARGVGALVSVPVRAVNLGSDVVAQALPGNAFSTVADQGSAELGNTVDAVVPLVVAYSRDPEGTKARIGLQLGLAAVNTAVAAVKGDGGAVSDIVSFGTQLAVPFAGEVALANFGGKAARTLGALENVTSANAQAAARQAAASADNLAAAGKGEQAAVGRVVVESPVEQAAGVAPSPAVVIVEQPRDASGRFLPRNGGELKPGGPFENRVGDVLRETNGDVVPQIRIQAADGTVTVLDFGSRGPGPNGRVKLTEAKSSETAPLSDNQRVAIPQIQTTGGVVVGSGSRQFPRGTPIPPTPVRVVRPSTMERLERLRRQREESAQ